MFNLVTTLGYGDGGLPKTDGGKVFVVFYSFFGVIMLLGVMLPMVGDILTRGLLWLVGLCVTGENCKLSEAAAEEDLYLACEISKFGELCFDLQQLELMKRCDFITFLVLQQRVERDGRVDPDELEVALQEFKMDARWVIISRYRLLVVLMFFIMVLFAGLYIFDATESSWSLTDSFYFTCTTALTIGMGPFYPSYNSNIYGWWIFVCLCLCALSTLALALPEVFHYDWCPFNTTARQQQAELVQKVEIKRASDLVKVSRMRGGSGAWGSSGAHSPEHSPDPSPTHSVKVGVNNSRGGGCFNPYEEEPHYEIREESRNQV